jgi:hypothetical protein
MQIPIKALSISMVLISFSALSCDSAGESEAALVKEGGPFAISEFAGNWEATQAGFLRISDNLWVDIIGYGGSLSLTVQSSGRSTFVINPADRAAYTVSGEMFWGSYEGDEALTIVWDDSPDADDRSSFRFIELTDTTFNMACSSECAEYDFDNNGTPEVADLSFEFVRN